MNFKTTFLEIDKLLFPYLYKPFKTNKLFLMLSAPFTVEGFNADMTEFNKNIDQCTKIYNEIQSQLNQANKIGDKALNSNMMQQLSTNGATGSWEESQNLSELGKQILSDPAAWLFGVIKNTFVLVWNNLFPVLKWLCLIVAIAGILYMLFTDGSKEGKKYTAGAVFLYIIFSILNAFIN